MTTDDEHRRPIAASPDHPVARIEEDHSGVRSRIEEIEAARTRAGLGSALDGLPEQLRQHFALEESEGGYFEDVARRQPAISPQLQRLREDHRAMLEQLDELCRQLADRARSNEPEEDIPPHLHGAVTEWVEKLRSHEIDESRIIADVYYTEEGGYG